MSGFAVLVYKAHPRLLIFPAVKKSAPYTRDYTVFKVPVPFPIQAFSRGVSRCLLDTLLLILKNIYIFVYNAMG